MISQYQMASAILAAGALLGLSEGKIHIGLLFACASAIVLFSGLVFTLIEKQDI